ncbi:MAG: alanyl-tRNA synthetase [Myxococcales bacterium SG8_38_1]|nr:MAG: alanyl-tRNA synthetase [Myxococcales bacterium SG8_38_1]
MSSSAEIRESFLRFFAEREHERVASGPLVPPNDPTLMFANAGMVQFKDVFTGKEERPYSRATSSQKCIRISGKHNDLENVGVTARHHTFFEMLGNFSFGNYFKRDAIQFAWDYFIGTLGLEPERLVVTVFGGEEGLAPADDEAAAIWKDVTGFSDERIIRCGAKDNFWQMGDTGPCGPCSEIHYCLGLDDIDPRTFGDEPAADGRGWFELWNLVFMQFERHGDGRMESLPAPSIDTGAGLERIAVVKQGVLSNYDTDLLRPIVDLASEISGKRYGASQADDDISMRVIADHARTTAFLISEGIFPDKDGRAYVLRRVMRRAIRHGHRLGIAEPFLHHCALQVVDKMGDVYPQLGERRALIEEITLQEEERFRRTLDRGLQMIADNEEWVDEGGTRSLPGDVAFKLYDTYGFPLDLQEVIGREQGFEIDQGGFDQQLEQARERSRGSKVGSTAVADVYPTLAQEIGTIEFLGYDAERAKSEVLALLSDGARVDSLSEGDAGELVTRATPFYPEQGGQVGDRGIIEVAGASFEVEDTQKPVEGLIVHRGRVASGSITTGSKADLSVDHELRGATRRNHSATHLLHWALRQVVGETAAQKGSLVGPDRLRFDYSGTRPLESSELARIEDLVNSRVLENTEITTEALPMDEAKRRGAIGIFEEKYGEVVRMLTIGPSLELCGGTHAYRTGDIGLFKVLSETGLAAGVRRIEATTGLNALRHLRSVESEVSSTAALLKAPAQQLHDRVERLLEQQKEFQREIERLKRSIMSGDSADLSADAREVDGARVLGATVDIGDAGALREMADQLRDKLAPAVILLGSPSKDGKKAMLVCSVSKALTDRFRAGDIVKVAASVVGGNGGGRPDFAQAGGPDPSKLVEAVGKVYELVGAA